MPMEITKEREEPSLSIQFFAWHGRIYLEYVLSEYK
jgi:hypothetical protein